MQTLSEYLTATGTRRDDFAAKVPTTEATVSRWCTRSVVPSDANKQRIAELTDGAVPVTVWFANPKEAERGAA